MSSRRTIAPRRNGRNGTGCWSNSAWPSASCGKPGTCPRRTKRSKPRRKPAPGTGGVSHKNGPKRHFGAKEGCHIALTWPNGGRGERTALGAPPGGCRAIVPVGFLCDFMRHVLPTNSPFLRRLALRNVCLSSNHKKSYNLFPASRHSNREYRSAEIQSRAPHKWK